MVWFKILFLRSQGQGESRILIIANNRQPQSDDYKPWFLWRNSRKGKGPEKSRFDNLLASVDAGDTRRT
jgi:hypothetical protein